MEERESSKHYKQEENKTYGPKESERILFEYMDSNGGMNFQDVLDFAKREDIWFGPEKNIFDVLTKKQALGYVEFNKTEKVYILTRPRRQPVY
jgi:hypothetical protein